MKMINGCFSVTKTALTCVQAITMGLFLATILSMDVASRAPGAMFNRLFK